MCQLALANTSAHYESEVGVGIPPHYDGVPRHNPLHNELGAP
jgi:hypothetical protein